jgi:regulator of protease activity HflC (stomatin/prohibitin superfamily)
MDAENTRSAASGYLFVAVAFLLAVVFAVSLYYVMQTEDLVLLVPIVVSVLALVFVIPGFFIVNPNDARVLVLFGSYGGTLKKNGFYWVLPFYVTKRVTLRARNLNGQRLKVNDKLGNPIEIAAVVVWKVKDTYRASFDVDDYEQYVVVQSEAAVRHLASSHPYDTFGDDESDTLTLRGGAEQVNAVLEQELGERLHPAGIQVIEARLSHLAYAPEIAEAMLRRQQASAVVAARTQIVTGAVSMVEMALEHLAAKKVVELDEERKAAMVSNLLVVLCSETSAAPVVNAGTLYQG